MRTVSSLKTINLGSPLWVLRIGLFWLLICPSAFGLERDRAIGQFHHTAWTAMNGAPSQITSFAQTEDGYLWIGSARGLYRFDGVQFEIYEPPPGVNLPGHNIYSLLATPDGGLWVVFNPTGIAFLKDGDVRVFTPDELPLAETYFVVRDLDARIWGATRNGLMLFDGARWQDVGPESVFSQKTIQYLYVDREGTLWVSVTDELFFLPRGSETFQKFDDRFEFGITQFAQAPDGRIWVVEHTKPIRPLAAPGQERPEIEIGDARRLLFDRDGCIWMISSWDGIRRIRYPERLGDRKVGRDAPEVESYKAANGLTDNSANLLFEDREGNIWVSTMKGLDRFRHSHLVPLHLPVGYQELTLLAGDGGDVWVGTTSPNPFLYIKGESLTKLSVPGRVSSVYRDQSGTVWWGVHNGICRQRNAGCDFFRQPVGRDDWMWEIFGSVDGGLWVGIGDLGLFHFKDDIWTGRTQPTGLPDRGPSASYRDPHGRMWLGYTEDRVYTIDGERVQGYSVEDGIDIGRIRVIRGHGPHYWFGGELGLAVFSNGRFHAIATSSGGRFGTISGIVETSDGSLWINEMNGIIHIPADEVRRVIDDPTHPVVYQLFDFLDGLPGGPQMDFRASTAVEAADGRLWFATDNGLAWINPATIRKNLLSPPVSIRSLNTDDRSYMPTENLNLPKGTESLRIVYNGLSLAIPERVRFKYKLDGVDAEWQDVGTRRQAFYTNLGPGDYRFQVIASNNDNVWNEVGATLDFTIEPAVYQTLWFRLASLLLALLLLAAIIAVLYSRRIAQTSARMTVGFEERLAERTRIAQDLHDTLLQGVVSASMQLDVAADQLPDDSPVKPRLIHIHELIGRVIEEGRNTVKGLRSSNVDPPDLEEQFLEIKGELDLSAETTFAITVEGPNRALHPRVHEEAYLIGREAIVNAFRHSGANLIEVEIEYAARDFKIVVRDDGSGIDEGFLGTGRDGHFGLSGMRERAEKISGSLKVRSSSAAGTEIEFSVPNHIAFGNQTHKRSLGWVGRWLWPK